MRFTEYNSRKESATETMTAQWVAWLICLLGAFFYCYEYLLRIEPSVMTQNLMQLLHTNAAGVGWVAGMYYFAYTPMQLIVGVLTDAYGARKVLTAAITACAVGSFLFGIATSVMVAAFARLLIGLGSSFAFVGALKLATLWLPNNRFAFFSGFVTTLGMVGAMFGEIKMTQLIHQIGFQPTIHIGTLLGIILIPLIWFGLSDRWHPSIHAKKNHVQDKLLKKPLKLVLFRDIFKGLSQIARNQQIWFAGLIGCFLYTSLSVFAELWSNDYLISAYHLTLTKAAFVTSMVFLGWLIGAPIMGIISDFFKNRRIPLTITAFLAMVTFLAILHGTMFFNYTTLCLIFCLFGALCSSEVLIFAIAFEQSPKRFAASSIAFANMLVMLGGMIFQPLVGSLLDSNWQGRLHHGIRAYQLNNFTHALHIIPIGLLIATILAIFLTNRDTHNE